jgi:hypothetical protein
MYMSTVQKTNSMKTHVNNSAFNTQCSEVLYFVKQCGKNEYLCVCMFSYFSDLRQEYISSYLLLSHSLANKLFA